MTLYVKGKPTTITVDDYIPMLNANPLSSKPPADNSVWAPILEKAYAKMVGNYEIIANGWQVESFKYLTGAPSMSYSISTTLAKNADTVWNLISDADSKNFLIGVDTNGKTAFGLRTNHAYTVLSTH